MGYRTHVFITVARTVLDRHDLWRVVSKLGAERGVTVKEPHVEDGFHLHGVYSGKFNQSNFVKKVHDGLPDGQSCRIQFAHTPKGTQKRGSNWPFEDMLKYVLSPVKDKVVDTEPLFHGADSVDMLMADHRADKAEGFFAELNDMRQNRVEKTEVIEAILPRLTPNNSHLYKVYMDYFNNLNIDKPVLVADGQSPRAWQRLVIGFAQKPIIDGETNGRGLWLNLPPGSGKSWIQSYLHDTTTVFIPGVRPCGSYDPVSFRAYNGESVILINDLAASVYEDREGNTVTKWKRNVVNMLKSIVDNVPLCIEFGGRRTQIYFNCRVIISSNFDLPCGNSQTETEALSRRYIVVDSEEAVAAYCGDEAVLEFDPLDKSRDSTVPLLRTTVNHSAEHGDENSSPSVGLVSNVVAQRTSRFPKTVLGFANGFKP